MVTWTPEAAEWLGFAAVDAIGMPVASLLAEEGGGAASASRFQEEAGRVGRATLHGQDGSAVDAWVRFDQIRHSAGEATFWLVTMTGLDSARYADMGSALLEAMFGNARTGLIAYDSDLRGCLRESRTSALASDFG
ncbi:hypothetical protein [Streptomyces cadmiisoli]|uniref:hypothetical protein n=1 Tax=Streptomyces cadmiisoli TaxID=2184053 RepID=UPI0013A6F346|nr:hypothetical protein [Streptomyces cadmiisoli]